MTTTETAPYATAMPARVGTGAPSSPLYPLEPLMNASYGLTVARYSQAYKAGVTAYRNESRRAEVDIDRPLSRYMGRNGITEATSPVAMAWQDGWTNGLDYSPVEYLAIRESEFTPSPRFPAIVAESAPVEPAPVEPAPVARDLSLFAMSFPALNGEWVLQGHADYCTANGHATHKVDGVLSPYCPRCGDTLPPESAPAVEAESAPVYTYQWEDTDTKGQLNCDSMAEAFSHIDGALRERPYRATLRLSILKDGVPVWSQTGTLITLNAGTVAPEEATMGTIGKPAGGVLNVYATANRLTPEMTEFGDYAETGWVSDLTSSLIVESRNDVQPLFSCWVSADGKLFTPGSTDTAEEQDEDLRDELGDLLESLGYYDTDDGSTLYATDSQIWDYTTDSEYLYQLHGHIKTYANGEYVEVPCDLPAIAKGL